MFLHSVSTGCNSFILDMMQESEEHVIKGGLHLLMMGERQIGVWVCVCMTLPGTTVLYFLKALVH